MIRGLDTYNISLKRTRKAECNLRELTRITRKKWKTEELEARRLDFVDFPVNLWPSSEDER